MTWTREDIERWIRELGEKANASQWQAPYKQGFGDALIQIMIKMDDERRGRAAAIETMRVPTDAMINAGELTEAGSGAEAVWGAMIDEWKAMTAGKDGDVRFELQNETFEGQAAINIMNGLPPDADPSEVEGRFNDWLQDIVGPKRK